MSQIQISSTNWLAILLKNGTVGVFDLNDISSWQCLKAESFVQQSNDENKTNFHCYAIKFSPNGQILVCNGHNKQINVYKQCDFEKTETWWQLKKIILLENSISSFELNNEVLLIADIHGDIYQIDLSVNLENDDLIIKADYCIIKNESMVLDMSFIHVNEKKLNLIIADHDNHIRLNHYPDVSKIDGYCHGHSEFISRIKLIDNNHILSASGDGTIRLWKLPNCVPLVLLHSKAFVLLSKQVSYTELDSSDYYQISNDSIPYESSLDSSSIVDYSIWKMDATCYYSNIYVAFSVFGYHYHSIYLTSVENMKQLKNEQCKLTIDMSYGIIVDYCFSSQFHDNSSCYLFILFGSNVILRIDVISVLLCNNTQLFSETSENIHGINDILSQKEFHIIDIMNSFLGLDDMMFTQLFKNTKYSNENISSQKRKPDKSEQQNQRKKQAASSEENEDDNSLTEYF